MRSHRHPPLQSGALVFGGRTHLGHAVHEDDAYLASVEMAGDGVMVRGLVIAQQHLEGIRVLPRAAGGNLGFGPGGRRATGDEPWWSARECSLAPLPALKATGDGIFGLTVTQRKGAAAVAKGEACG